MLRPPHEDGRAFLEGGAESVRAYALLGEVESLRGVRIVEPHSFVPAGDPTGDDLARPVGEEDRGAHVLQGGLEAIKHRVGRAAQLAVGIELVNELEGARCPVGPGTD